MIVRAGIMSETGVAGLSRGGGNGWFSPMGGAIALSAAATRPPAIRRVGLMGTMGAR